MTSSAGVRLEKDIWRTIVICPNCGEDNAPNFRFCGMCGTLLDARRPAGAPAPNPVSAVPPASPTLPAAFPPKTTNAPEPVRPVAVENATRTPSKPLPPISGPSILGLNQFSPNQPSANQPSLDSLREEPFSSLDSFFERERPEQPKTGGRRILLLVLLLAALGGAGWWTYAKYLGAMGNRKPETAASSASEAPAEKPPAQPATQNAAPAPDASSSQTAAPSAGAPAVAPSAGAENAGAGPETTPKIADSEAKSVEESKPAAPAKIAPVKPLDKRRAKREPRLTAKRSPSPPPAADDTGDADFRKGEAYLYGRGAPKNCDQAVKYLKTASAQSNAKARSTFGTMYATGHCVPRDLPTSYLWFALALRADPNNQILEKDLSAIWNQMTPPERQLATRMKQ